MSEFFVLFVHLLVKIAQLMKPDGARAIVAENLLLKQQLLVACRAWQRAPRLSTLDDYYSAGGRYSSALGVLLGPLSF